jgi:tetratricopeptide (TPR) repeat protein
MKKTHAWIAAAGVAAAAVAISLVAVPSKVEWTTSSPEALQEFERATEARMKLYDGDAARHLERAIELDPDFVFAKFLLAEVLINLSQPERAQSLFEEALAAGLSGLRPRERFAIQRAQALQDRRYTDAAKLTKEYYEKYPNDPYIIERAATDAKNRGDMDQAERLYLHLLEVAPNWVTAYNWLGYIAMTQGRFAVAEEYFTSFRFIAPEQANPHDSLAELYIVQGRYGEAETALETAIRIKPDFWPAYAHLVQARGLMRDFPATWDALNWWAAQDGSNDRVIAHSRRVVAVAELDYDRAWGELVNIADAVCLEETYPGSYLSRTIHRAACQIGSWEVADHFEMRLEKYLERAQRQGAGRAFDEAWPALLYMTGVRLALQGDYAAAEERFRRADSQLTYRESAPAIFKLKTRLLLVETLLAQGKDVEAHELLDKVRRVNPSVVAEFEEDGLNALGLGRG